MKSNQYVWTNDGGWQPKLPSEQDPAPQLVFLFGGIGLFEADGTRSDRKE